MWVAEPISYRLSITDPGRSDNPILDIVVEKRLILHRNHGHPGDAMDSHWTVSTSIRGFGSSCMPVPTQRIISLAFPPDTVAEKWV